MKLIVIFSSPTIYKHHNIAQFRTFFKSFNQKRTLNIRIVFMN